ncbi:MAG: arginine-tRNA-protein transferase [Acidobacteriota bacterium]|nr:MAG: arginine-tRNA-protein transferase [Acidobacteriota bacterium]
MDFADFIFINEEFRADKVSPEELGRLLAKGWRHFGKYFFRYSIAYHDNKYRRVMPLRIRLGDFSLSRSLKRIARRNVDLEVSVGKSFLDEEKQRLFDIHKQRFRGPRPGSILHFLDAEPGSVPCPGLEFCVRGEDGSLMAISFADEADDSLSSVYAMFDPAHSRRSLGIYTILLEVEHAKDLGKEFHYLGYAYEGSSFYDYKKRFSAIERYDWQGNWVDFEE